MLLNVSCMTPFLQLMIAFDVARKGLPSMIGMQLVPLAIGVRIKNNKIHWVVEFVNLN